jgi:Patatin-like phospholipase
MLVITPETPDRLYSTRLRTAVVLTGSGTAGAYHAGVLRALHEAGVRTDLVAGRGMGAASAMFAAVDGGARLWDSTGVWKTRTSGRFYNWRTALRVAGLALVTTGIVLLFPLFLFALAIVVGLAGFLLTLVGLEEMGSALTIGFTSRLAALFAPEVIPTIVPRLALLGVLTAAAALAISVGARHVSARVRARAGQRRRDWAWRLVTTPLTTSSTVEAFASELWALIKGAAPLQQPRDAELGRRYIELLTENLGQPGFRELLVVVNDLDARQDAVFAFLAEQHRTRFFGRPVPGANAVRGAEAFDLSGVARDHSMDILAASLAMPVATEPHLVAFAAEGPWRGETHRLCDRPGSLARVLEEVLVAGVEQVVLLSASPRSGRPHELNARRIDPRGSAGEQLSAFEASALRDVLEQFTGRFAGLYVIRPEHNPLGPFDFSGTHDERSDRRFTVAELVDRGYEDAYRQFIDPVVGASGERIQSISGTG